MGQMTRRCRITGTNTSAWDDPDYQYCLPKYPPSGMGYVDYSYSIPHSKTVVISNNPQGIVKAVSSVYNLPSDAVSVYWSFNLYAGWTSCGKYLVFGAILY